MPTDHISQIGKIRTDIMKQIHDSGLKLLAPKSKDELYESITSELTQLVGANFVSVYRANHRSLIKEYTNSQILEKINPKKRGFTYKTFNKSTPHIINSEYLWQKHPKLKEMGIKSTINIPLNFDLEAIGVLSLDFDRDVVTEITDDMMHGLQLFASVISYKIKNIELQQRLSETVQNQKLFMSLASHELKNPLTAVLGYATLVQRQVKKGREVKPELLSSLISEIERMTSLIDELLNVRNSDLDKASLIYNKKESKLSDIVRSTISSFALSYPNRSVVMEDMTQGRDIVNADPLKMKQVISNLLVNAAKFSDVTTKIKIVLKIVDHHILLQVIDQGIGISKKHYEQIFKQFYKAHKHKKEGMGLGLYLSKKIIDNHDGTISVSSKKGEGTTFEIILPVIK